MDLAPNLADTIAEGDAYYLALLDEADAYVTSNGLDLIEEPGARTFLPDPECLSKPLRNLDLAASGVTTILWATGYAVDFSWLQVDTFDEHSRPKHQRGIAKARGLYFLGLPWLSGRGSSFIWGVWQDARHIAEHIAIERSYLQGSLRRLG
jgi:putative flavoprotein involved in K+ transport